MMDKIQANYTTQPNRNFPLDCETLQALQEQIGLAQILGRALGDKIILTGCEETNHTRTEGYIFLRTEAEPEGEVLRFEGGVSTYGLYVKETSISVTANGYDYPQAYTQRTLAPGLGTEHYDWVDFERLKTPSELEREIATLRAQHDADLARLEPRPYGIVELWAGTNVPTGYALCDGRELKIEDYPNLSNALGTTFNRAKNANGQPYTTQNGYFRLPDLRGRFVVGQSDTDEEYNFAKTGGEKKHLLTSAEMAAHSHVVKDFVQIPKGNGEITYGQVMVDGESCTAGSSSLNGIGKRAQTAGDHHDFVQWIEHATNIAGEGVPHENRPPFYVLAYIMRLG